MDSTKSLAANVFDILRDLASVDASVSKGRKLGQLNNFVKIVRNVFARNVRLQRQQRKRQQQQQLREQQQQQRADETISQQPSRAGAAETFETAAARRDVPQPSSEADSGRSDAACHEAQRSSSSPMSEAVKKWDQVFGMTPDDLVVCLAVGLLNQQSEVSLWQLPALVGSMKGYGWQSYEACT